MNNKQKVLFLCTGNSCRSQMAEAILREYAGDKYEVFSAGIEYSQVNPYAIKVLKEIRVDTDPLFSKPITKFLGKETFDYLITVCSNAEERCPYFPGIGERLHWPFEDPYNFEGSEKEKLEKYREVRDLIKNRITSWLKG
jgi:arsenate reductase